MGDARRGRSRSARIREELGHPVIDGDGHVIELTPVFADFARDHGAGAVFDAARRHLSRGPEQQRARAAASTEMLRRAGSLPDSWHVPAKPDYYATVSVPALYHERLGEAGIDFAVLYPTLGLGITKLLDDEQRVTVSRLYNEFMAEQYGPYRDRFTVAALIPMNTPDEAIAAMEHAKRLGAKVGLIASHVRRPFPGDPWPPDDPGAELRIAPWEVNGWVDTYGLDSVHDYDPVWAKAVELRLPLAAHSSGIGFSDRSSISNLVYNHIGHFAASGGALAKSLFLGGVTRRFPDLRVAFLEGGVTEGVRIYISLVAAWTKRGGGAIARLDPAALDRDELARLYARDPRLARYSIEQLTWSGGPKAARDDFAAAGITSVEDIRDQFCGSFAWGCEADDRLVRDAFDPRLLSLGARVPAMFGSDLGHWDVPDFSIPLEEAHELVDDGLLDEEQFRAFVFENPVRFYGSLDPDFFAGTSVDRHAAGVAGRAASMAVSPLEERR
jgi:predicted TIM-barrel fold metal-dependent hydrolase